MPSGSLPSSPPDSSDGPHAQREKVLPASMSVGITPNWPAPRFVQNNMVGRILVSGRTPRAATYRQARATRRQRAPPSAIDRFVTTWGLQSTDASGRQPRLVNLYSKAGSIADANQPGRVCRKRFDKHEFGRFDPEIGRVVGELDIGCANGSCGELKGGGQHDAVAPGMRREDDAAFRAMAGDRREAGDPAGERGISLQDVV